MHRAILRCSQLLLSASKIKMADISSLTQILTSVETTISRRQDELMQAASVLAYTVGPHAAAHRLAELAIEFYAMAEQQKELE